MANIKILSPLQITAITNIVKDVMNNGYSIDKTINFYFKNNRISNDFDREVISFGCNELVRWWRLLLEIDNNYPVSLEPDYAKIFGIYLIINNLNSGLHSIFKHLNKEDVITQLAQLARVRKIKNSIPDWLDIKGYAAYGANWDSEIEALNHEPPIFLRTNRLKVKPAELLQLLTKEGVKCSLVDSSPDAIKLLERINIFSSQYYSKGFFEIQDAGSQLISLYLNAQPGMRVCDACAGNGGKTLHLASIMQNKGKIIALDNQAHKLKMLKSRAVKAGCEIIETKEIEGTKTIKRLENSFDRLLLDVPCSGSGAIRRNPELKWKTSPDRIEKLKIVQSEILQKYQIMLRSGGILVYATCSILPEENQEQVQKFLNNNKQQFELIKEQTISTASTGFDGFYMAQIRKK